MYGTLILADHTRVCWFEMITQDAFTKGSVAYVRKLPSMHVLQLDKCVQLTLVL